MRNAFITTCTAGLAVPLAIGCGTDDADPAEGASSSVSAVKSDCPDCDPAGPNAFVQAGVGDAFYDVGDTWQVAYRFDHSPMAEKRGGVFLATDEVPSEVFLFEYRVIGTDKDVFANVLRQTATIEVSQGTPGGPNGALFSPARVDRHEPRNQFTLNDLLEPVAEKVFSRRYPHGKLVALDAKSNLRPGASLYPRTVPRVLASGAVDSPAPELPDDLRDVVDAHDSDWANATYKKYTFPNGDTVYWSVGRGQLWPFYVETRRGAGVLLGYQASGQ